MRPQVVLWRGGPEAVEQTEYAPWNPTRSTTLATMMPTRVCVESRPSETMSVVAHPGGWMVSVPIIAQFVSTMEAVALAASRKPPAAHAAGVAVRG